MRSNQPDQPNPNLTHILTLGANLIRLNPILDLEGTTRPENGLGLYRVEPKFEPFLRLTRPNWTRSWILRANPTR